MFAVGLLLTRGGTAQEKADIVAFLRVL